MYDAFSFPPHVQRARDAASSLAEDAEALAVKTDTRALGNVLRTVAHHAKGVNVNGRHAGGRIASANMCVAVLDALLDDAGGWDISPDTLRHVEALWQQARAMADLTTEAVEATRTAHREGAAM